MALSRKAFYFLLAPVIVFSPKRKVSVGNKRYCNVTLLDLSYEKNRDAVERLLNTGADVRYFDHHFAGEVARHSRLEVHIDTGPQICTSTLVNDYLNGRHAKWAVVAAFGDALPKVGNALAHKLGLEANVTEVLASLGHYLKLLRLRRGYQ
ncbi:hypothetical protein BPMI_00023c [Candidatus Burkholderia pumila]|uniref:Uncharacterized protein n=1 Tax=Candidatus Burkholderia pumila TaxID=1090375 RepID=A0ABR5HJS9_9BURK|nr:hypothetical protein BPMI_00023c [Candidatus Burkholderia pumila]